ncbi:hypothetical protein Tco_0758636, partial [Tanacetum coccineum]
MLDTQQFTYTVDVFRDTLHLPMETPKNPFVAPANIHTIKAFMNRFGYQCVVDKVSAFFMKNLAQPWQTMFKVFNPCLTTRTTGHDQTKINILQLFQGVLNRTHVYYAALLWWDFMNNKFPNIPKRLEEDYHSIRDNVPLEIREMNDFNEYETVFMKDAYRSASPHESKKRKQTAGESSSRRIIVKKKKQSTPSIPPPGDDRERDEMAEATLLSLTLHKTALDAEAKENIAKGQEMLEQEKIDKLVDGDEDKESYASTFANSVINNDDDDTGSKLEPGSHKEHPEHVSDDDETKRKDEEVEKEKEVVEIVKEKNVDDISAKKNNEVVTEKEVVNMSGSQEIRKEQKQTPISSHIRSPRNNLSSDKTISEELADTVTPTNATSSKTPSTTTRKKKSFTLKTRHLPGITMTNEMLKKEMPRLVKLAVNKDREVSSVDISEYNSQSLSQTNSSTTTTSSADLQQQLYL